MSDAEDWPRRGKEVRDTWEDDAPLRANIQLQCSRSPHSARSPKRPTGVVARLICVLLVRVTRFSRYPYYPYPYSST